MHAEILCQLIEKFAPNGIGVEIGINRGSTSKKVLEHTSTRHLYMIDPWMRNYDPGQGLYSTKHDPDEDHKYVVKYFSANFPDRHTLIRKKAENATKDVPDDLDFIFIDGNHIYKYVMRDLNFWTPKVKSQGLVSGHDWWSKFPGVVGAVTDFCEANDFFLPPQKLEGHVPAPSKKPVVMKSWPRGHMWWAIKK